MLLLAGHLDEHLALFDPVTVVEMDNADGFRDRGGQIDRFVGRQRADGLDTVGELDQPGRSNDYARCWRVCRQGWPY